MSDAEAETLLWIIGAFMALLTLFFGLYLLGDSASYSSCSGKGGNSDPDNPWLQL